MAAGRLVSFPFAFIQIWVEDADGLMSLIRHQCSPSPVRGVPEAQANKRTFAAALAAGVDRSSAIAMQTR